LILSHSWNKQSFSASSHINEFFRDPPPTRSTQLKDLARIHKTAERPPPNVELRLNVLDLTNVGHPAAYPFSKSLKPTCFHFKSYGESPHNNAKLDFCFSAADFAMQSPNLGKFSSRSRTLLPAV